MSKVYYIKNGELYHGELRKSRGSRPIYTHPSQVVLTPTEIEEAWGNYLAGMGKIGGQRLVFEKDMIDSGRDNGAGSRIYYYQGKTFTGKTKKEAAEKANKFAHALIKKKHEVYDNQHK